MKKSLFAVAICLAVNASWSRGDTEAQKKSIQEVEAKKVETAALLSNVAFAVSRFSTDVGCVPRSPTDIVRKPSKDRLRELGCKEGEGSAVNSEYLAPSLREPAMRLKFVRKSGGPLLIEYRKLDGSMGQCSFYEAEQSKCELGLPAVVPAK